MSTLDYAAARAVARARLLERAVHDSGPWQIEIAGIREDAVKVRTPHRVLFLANFYSVPDPDATVAWLLCDGQFLSSKDIRLGDSGPFSIEWSIIGPDSLEPSSPAVA
jgi:hypothetical protein